MTSSYVELHLHTAYSFLDGASLPEDLVARAKDLGYEALAVTDHDGLYGAMEFAQHAHAAGIAPITGAELTLTDGSHLTLLAATRPGYANLCRLITEAHRVDKSGAGSRQEKRRSLSAPDPSLRPIGKTPHRYRDKDELAPRLDPALLASHTEGLILLTGCRQGKLARLVDDGRFREAEGLLRQYIAWLGAENVVVELQQNLVYGDTLRINRLIELADHLGVRYAATGNVHYHVKERHRLQDVLVAIRHRTTLDGSHRERRPNAEFYLRSADEMSELFARYPEALETTVQIAERCADFNLARDLDYRFPDYETGSNETPDEMLARVCHEELRTRYGDNPIHVQTAPSAAPGGRGHEGGSRTAPIQDAQDVGTVREPPGCPNRSPDDVLIARERLNNELSLIARHKLAGFFLLYRDLLVLAREVADEIRGIDSARARGNLPPGRGRGSSVSSIVCYLIGLSHVDPLKHNLSVDRFLNEDLSSVPDIDLDFPREIRERLIERVYETYDNDRVALVCAFATYRLRSAVRDVGRALGIPQHDLDQIAKLSWSYSAHDLGKELARLPAYAARIDVPPWSYLIELSNQLAGLPRHITQHVGGMIVSATPLSEVVPIQPAAMEGRAICQWDKDSCEDGRFIKIDFLALGMLSLVEECLELIAAAGKEPVDLSRIDLDEPAIYDMICAGDTIGTFQIESRAQIQMLPSTYPRKLDHLVVQVAIVRPGPIIGGAVKPYVKHRQQERQGFLEDIEPVYDDPRLKSILEETLGVILYQEQVVEVARALAKFTAGQADGLRRAMTRKRSREGMLRWWEQFRDGALDNGVSLKTAKAVFKKLLGFSAYGFPKSHAVAFAILAYQSAWLKYHHPTEFVCALLNNQPMGFYPPHALINDAKRHGVRVLPPDINRSGVRCTIEETNAIRIGIGYIKGLGDEPAQRIVLERTSNGQYRSLPDFIRRVPLPTEVAEHLAMVDAFDGFGLGRREALWQVGLFVPSRRFGRKRQTDAGRQIPLALPIEQDAAELRPMHSWEQTIADYSILGLSAHYHPLGVLRSQIRDGVFSTAQLADLPGGLTVRVGGLVVCRQRPGTAKGFTFLLLEDEHGLVNVVVHPTLYEKQRFLVRAEPFLLVEGPLQKRDGTINLIAKKLSCLEEACKTFAPPRPTDSEDVTPDKETRRARRLRALAPASHDFH